MAKKNTTPKSKGKETPTKRSPKKSSSAKGAAPKTTAKKARRKPARKSRRTTRASKGPAVTVPNHRFSAGTKVGFHEAHLVNVERGLGREPFGDPDQSATVHKDGTLEVRGLAKGMWCAVGPVGERFAYVQFSVK